MHVMDRVNVLSRLTPSRYGWGLLDCAWVLVLPCGVCLGAVCIDLGAGARIVLTCSVFLVALAGYFMLWKKVPAAEAGVVISRLALGWTMVMVVLDPALFIATMCVLHECYRMLVYRSVLGGFLGRIEQFRVLTRADMEIAAAGALGIVSEEVMFRGILLEALKRKIGISPAIVLQACLFGCLHYFAWGKDAVFPAAVLAGVSGWCVQRARSLWPAIFGHAFSWVVLILIWR